MNQQELWQALRARFGDAILDCSEPKAGDAFVGVKAERLHEVCEFLKADPSLDFDYLQLITGVELADALTSIYHFYSYSKGHSLVLRALLSKDDPRIQTISDLWPAANWLERETFDMLGIVYQGHPDLRRILLPMDWEGHPLRKNYQAPKDYHGISNE